MAAKRRTDPRSRPVYRTDRMVQEGDKWFFFTREGTTEGPFDSELEASQQLEQYLRVIDSGLLPEGEADLSAGPRVRQRQVS